MAAANHPAALTFGHLVLECGDDLVVTWHMLGDVDRPKLSLYWSWSVEFDDVTGASQQITVRPSPESGASGPMYASLMHIQRVPIPPPRDVIVEGATIDRDGPALTLAVPLIDLPGAPAAGGRWRGWGSRSGAVVDSFCAIGHGELGQ